MIGFQKNDDIQNKNVFHLIGMSTIPEVLVARHCKMGVFAFYLWLTPGTAKYHLEFYFMQNQNEIAFAVFLLQKEKHYCQKV